MGETNSVNLKSAYAQLGQLVRDAERGVTTTITDRGRPAAIITAAPDPLNNLVRTVTDALGSEIGVRLTVYLLTPEDPDGDDHGAQLLIGDHPSGEITTTVVPRIGERVSLPGDDRIAEHYRVHDVHWEYGGTMPYASVYVIQEQS